MKKIFLISTSAVVLTWATPILTNDTDTVVSRSGDVLVDSVNKKGIFQWLEGGFGYTNKKLSYDLTAFKVLRENKSAVRYLQTSLRRKGAENTFNIGFGTRNAINDARTTLIGANIFIDSKDGAGKFYTFGNKAYKRLSLGLELKTGGFDLSANMYRPMGSAVILGRKVMKGFDMTAKGTVTDTLNIGLNTYKFDGVADKVEQGNKLILEFKPNSIITIRGEYDKPKSSSAQTNVYAGFKFAFGTSNTTQQNSSGNTWGAWAKRYDKVERSYEVKTAEAETMQPVPIAGRSSISSKGGTAIRSGDGTTEDTAFQLSNNNKYDIKSFVNLPDVVTPTVTAAIVDGKGTEVIDFQFRNKNDDGDVAIANVNYDSILEDKTGAGVAVLKLTYTASGYKAQEVFVKTDKLFDESDLSMADLEVPYVSGDGVVSADDILAKLSVSGDQSQKSEWTLKSLTDKDSAGPSKLVIAADKKSLTIKSAISGGTTITAEFSHGEYGDVSKDFKLSTSAGQMSLAGQTRSGSGKWGKAYTTDYKLKTSDTVGDTTVDFVTGASGDFTFAILANGASGSSTTAGIVSGVLSDAIDNKTGVIDGTKLTKGGTVTVQITRTAKGGLPKLVENQNFTVSKQGSADHPSFAVSASAITWAAASQTVTYTETSKPAGIATPTYALTNSGTTAGALAGGVGSIAVASANGKISNTVRSGVVKVKLTYAANDKYDAITKDIDVTINRQAKQATSGSVSYTAAAWGGTFNPDLGGMKEVAGTDVYTPTYTRKSSTNGGTADVGGTVAPSTGAVTNTASSGTITVTVAYPQNVRYEAGDSQDVTIAVNRKAQTAAVKSGHGSWSTSGTPQMKEQGVANAPHKSVRDAVENVLGGWGSHITMAVADAADSIASGASYGGSSDYTLADNSSGRATTKALAISRIANGNNVWIRGGGVQDNDDAVRITFTFGATADGKYAAGTANVVTFWRTN